jgi:DNA-binding transcriptional MerR regulator
MTRTEELEHAERVVEEIDDLEALEDHVSDDRDALRTVHRLRERRLGEIEAIRVSVAAQLLGLSEPTVRAWADSGLLEYASLRPVRRLRLKSVLHLRPVVTELRSLGRQRGLMEAVVARLEDRRTLNDRRLLESLAQMRAGELIDITPPE